MRLSETARASAEDFLRKYLRDDRIALSDVRVHGGPLVDQFTNALGIAAITLGQRIFVSRRYLRRDRATGRVTMPGRLLIHEATHAVQYRRLGWTKFLAGYLRDYFGHLRRQKKIDAAARHTAYLAIRHEVEARRAEEAYVDREQ